MRALYPEIDAWDSFYLDVDEPHSLYVEQAGNPAGIPVVFLHGGPGSGCSERHRRYFDPRKYRITLFDQRGCHRSRPAGETAGNSTVRLIADIERIRMRLRISRWLVFGGSWGATLGLLYAQAHPQCVSGLLLRGVFLARARDLDWFFRDGVNRIYPDFWQEFTQSLSAAERADPVRAFHARVHGPDEPAAVEAALAWARWSGRIVHCLSPGMDLQSWQPEDGAGALGTVRIETHYAANRYFIAENQLLDNLDRLPTVPTTIIHGRRDLTCALDSAWVLQRGLPAARLVIVESGGHLASDPAMVDALVTATDEMAQTLAARA